MSKQNIELSKQIHTISFSAFGVVVLSQSCSSFRLMFFIGETLLFLDIKAKYPFAPTPTRRPCCEQNNNTIFFTSERN